MIAQGKLPARKAFISQLLKVVNDSAPNTYIIGNVKFSRAWIQGMLVSLDEKFMYLDDGTGIIAIQRDDARLASRGVKPAIGKVYNCIGPLRYSVNGMAQIINHKFAPIEDQPDRESLWILEVIFLQRKFFT